MFFLTTELQLNFTKQSQWGVFVWNEQKITSVKKSGGSQL